MKIRLALVLLNILLLSSCNNNQEIDEINALVNINNEFAMRMLNTYRGDYYQLIEEVPGKKNEQISELETEFEALIANIDDATLNNNIKIENIKKESHQLISKIQHLVEHNSKYTIPKENTENSILPILSLKNKLILSMAYAFEYAARPNFITCGYNIVKVDTKIQQISKKETKIILSSKDAQIMRENRYIIIDTIQHDNQIKKINYKLEENYNFADINLGNLAKGSYTLKGHLKYYHRDGKFTIPFQEKFVIK